MLEQAEDMRSDIRSLGRMMVECLEPRMALRNNNCLVNTKCDPVLLEFQTFTAEKTAAELLKVSPLWQFAI